MRSPVGLWLATTARATPRDAIADIWKRITRLQGNYGIRQYSVITFEKSGGIHAHITFLGTRTLRNVSNSRYDLANSLMFVPSLT